MRRREHFYERNVRSALSKARDEISELERRRRRNDERFLIFNLRWSLHVPNPRDERNKSNVWREIRTARVRRDLLSDDDDVVRNQRSNVHSIMTKNLTRASRSNTGTSTDTTSSKRQRKNRRGGSENNLESALRSRRVVQRLWKQ